MSKPHRLITDHLHGMVDEQLARPVSALARVTGFADSVATQLSRTRGLARDLSLRPRHRVHPVRTSRPRQR